jgi:Asp-tRNA(Asn)/Glu-tRNA(Gln) amidotransferase C subunit
MASRSPVLLEHMQKQLVNHSVTLAHLDITAQNKHLIILTMFVHLDITVHKEQRKLPSSNVLQVPSIQRMAHNQSLLAFNAQQEVIVPRMLYMNQLGCVVEDIIAQVETKSRLRQDSDVPQHISVQMVLRLSRSVQEDFIVEKQGWKNLKDLARRDITVPRGLQWRIRITVRKDHIARKGWLPLHHVPLVHTLVLYTYTMPHNANPVQRAISVEI